MTFISTRSDNRIWMVLSLLIVLCASREALAQTTSFTYQGKLSDNGNLANTSYDMQFKLFDNATVSTGTQQGGTVTLSAVQVTDGIFTVQLDFGAAAFPGADRFIEIAVKPTGGPTYTKLAPRQPVSSTPYAIRSLNSITADGLSVACMNCIITSSQIQSVQGSQITGTLPAGSIPAGSANYIQNTTSQQASSNFNISGNGTAGGSLAAGVVDATTQYNLNGNRILSGNVVNLFAGVNAGRQTTGQYNSFFGSGAGGINTTGFHNSFFGADDGQSNFGGYQNSFFGFSTGHDNTDGARNSFFGDQAGFKNTTGNDNVFIGDKAGYTNTTENLNTFIGSATLGATGITNATAIGANARVTQSNSLVLGSINATNGATADTNVGIGTTAPAARLHISVNSGRILLGDAGCSAGFTGLGFASSLSGCANYSLLGNGTDTIINRPSGGFISFREANANQLSIATGGAVTVNNTLALGTLGSAGSTQLCRNSSNQIATCSSSLRYKTNLAPYRAGLDVINRLRPITFDWKAYGMHDLGFGAEDVEKIEPLLVTYNDKGQVEGVKYDRISAVLVNAVRDQQEQIAAQQKQIDELKSLKAENAALIAKIAAILARLGHAKTKRADEK